MNVLHIYTFLLNLVIVLKIVLVTKTEQTAGATPFYSMYISNKVECAKL